MTDRGPERESGRARYELTVAGVVGPAVDRMLHTAGVTTAATVTCVRATVTGPRSRTNQRAASSQRTPT